MDEVREVADPSQRVVLVCNMGGSLDPGYAPSKFGMQSRRASLEQPIWRPASAAMQFVCGWAGTIALSMARRRRSLMAAYELYISGFNNVGVLKGGFNDWTKSGRCKDLRNLVFTLL